MAPTLFRILLGLVALYAVLIEPAQRAGLLRDAERLIVVPHSVLSYVPFAALKERERSHFLIEDYDPHPAIPGIPVLT